MPGFHGSYNNIKIQKYKAMSWRQKFYTDDINQCLHNLVIMGFQM